MGTTGLIYVAIVAAWAAYLVPMMLKRSDEVRKRRSAEKYSSSAARVLSRDPSRPRYVVRPASETNGSVSARTGVPSAESGAVVGSAGAGPVPGAADVHGEVVGSAGTGPGPGRAGSAGAGWAGAGAGSGGAGGPVGADSSPPRRYVPNRARRVAAMRRRRVLSLLTLSLLSVTALASLQILLWWTVAIPAALIVAFVVLTRIQLRRQARERARLAAERRARAQTRHDRGPAGLPAPTPPAVSTVDQEPTVEVKLPTAEPEPPKEGLWDPVPVTLPTYVLKEKAPDRTVRTISLTDDEVFSSARTTDPATPPAPTAEPEPITEEEPEIKRAVGD